MTQTEIDSLLTEGWTAGLKSALASMTSAEHPLTITPVNAADAAADSGEPWTWYSQDFNVLPGTPALFAGAADRTWHALGAGVLAALGVDDASAEDSQATSRDLVGQSSGALAQELTAEFETEVSCKDLTPASRPSAKILAISIGGLATDVQPVLWLAIESALCEKLLKMDSLRHAAPPPPAAPKVRPGGLPKPLADLHLDLYVSMGRTTLRLDNILRLNVGSIIDLGRSLNDPVDVIVNGRVINHGQVVVCNGNYAVQIIAKE